MKRLASLVGALMLLASPSWGVDVLYAPVNLDANGMTAILELESVGSVFEEHYFPLKLARKKNNTNPDLICRVNVTERAGSANFFFQLADQFGLYYTTAVFANTIGIYYLIYTSGSSNRDYTDFSEVPQEINLGVLPREVTLNVAIAGDISFSATVHCGTLP